LCLFFQVNFPSWPELKSSGTLPFAQLPVLQLPSGDSIAQSIAIMNFVADKSGMSPKDPQDRALIMSFVLSVEDILMQLFVTFMADEDTKQKKRGILSDSLKPMLSSIDSFIAKHGKNGCCFGDKPSIADCYLLQAVEFYLAPEMKYLSKDIFQPFANITKAVSTISSNPKIKPVLEESKALPFFV